MLSKVRISDLKRQIEITAMIAERNNYYTKYDLAVHFIVDETRIHRDIGDLRKIGVNIHSRKSRYSIESGDNSLRRFMRLYVALTETDAETVAAIEPVHTPCMLARTVKLNRAIQSRRNIQILHENVWKEIKPTGLCYTNNEYCLIAEHRNEMTLFPIRRIKNMR